MFSLVPLHYILSDKSNSIKIFCELCDSGKSLKQYTFYCSLSLINLFIKFGCKLNEVLRITWNRAWIIICAFSRNFTHFHAFSRTLHYQHIFPYFTYYLAFPATNMIFIWIGSFYWVNTEKGTEFWTNISSSCKDTSPGFRNVRCTKKPCFFQHPYLKFNFSADLNNYGLIFFNFID